MAKKPFYMVLIPERCKECGICMAFCPKNILQAGEDGRPELTDPEACSGCKQCEYYCPDFAIHIEAEQERKAEKQKSEVSKNSSQ